MSEQEQSTTTTTTTTEARGEWQILIAMVAPQQTDMVAERCPSAPTYGEIHSAVQRFSANVDLGADADGCPIIAYEALFDVRVVDPDGRQHPVIFQDTVWWRQIVGALEEHAIRQRRGDGVVEERRHPTSPEGLDIWVWRPAE